MLIWFVYKNRNYFKCFNKNAAKFVKSLMSIIKKYLIRFVKIKKKLKQSFVKNPLKVLFLQPTRIRDVKKNRIRRP